MRLITPFDPSLASGEINVGSANANSKILLYNVSVSTIKLNFENGNTALLHAGEANYWVLDGSTSIIEWALDSTLDAIAVQSRVTGQVYAPEETITGTYPMSLIYQSNVSNPGGIQTVGGIATSVVNTGTPAGTHIVDSAAGNDLQNSVTLTNQGQLVLGQPGGAGLHNSFLEIGYPGTLQLDVPASQGAGGQIQLSVDVSGRLIISTNGGLHQVVIQGNSNITLDAGNGAVNTNTVNLTTGSFSRVSTFTAAVTTTPTFFNHGLGATPDIVIPVIDGSAAAAGRVVEAESSTWTTTQVRLTAAASFNVLCIAIKK